MYSFICTVVLFIYLFVVELVVSTKGEEMVYKSLISSLLDKPAALRVLAQIPPRKLSPGGTVTCPGTPSSGEAAL